MHWVSYNTSNCKILYLTSMSTSPPNLTYSILTVCKIIVFRVDKKVFFPCTQRGQQSFEGQKNHFSSWYGMCLSIFLFLSKLGTCPQNLIPTRGVEHWEKNHFPQGGMLKFTYKVFHVCSDTESTSSSLEFVIISLQLYNQVLP
jgi:hypothetical protein